MSRASEGGTGAAQEEWDPLLLVLLLQLAKSQRARQSEASDWVAVDALSNLLGVAAARGRAALDGGWPELAEGRGFVEHRRVAGRSQVRLTRAGRRLFRFD